MRIRLLGPVDIVDGGRAVALGGAKERIVLAVLALNAGNPVPATRVADAIWGDDQPRTAAATLRSHVSRLRRAVQAGGIDIESTPGGLCLRAPADAVDVAAVEALVEQGRIAPSPEEAAARFGEALGHWRGPSLGDLADRPFAVAEAARLDEFRAAVLEQHVTAELACGRHAAVATVLETHCESHPYREGLWASRILALYRCGRQADALRCYGELRARLVNDLGIDPSPALRELEQLVLTQSSSLDWAPPTGPRLAPSSERRVPIATSRPLVGRSRELDVVATAWDRAVHGEPAAILLGGEPGIGKTRLALAAAELAESCGGVAVYGRSDEHGGRPFGPIAEAAERLLAQHPPDQREAAVRPWAVPLSALIPSLAGGAPPPELVERSAVFDAVVGVLAHVSAVRPILVVLDDLQWAGPETTLLLAHALRSRVPLRVLVVGAFRDTEVGDDHPVSALLGEPGVSRVGLHGLDISALAELLDRDAEAAARIARQSGGNPFIALEFDRHADEAGTAPAEVHDLLRRRFRLLGEPATAVLRLAAVLGEEFSARLLDDVHGGDDADAVLNAVDAAVRSRLLEDRGGGRFAFSHSLVRTTLLDDLTSARRARLHRQIADALADGDDLDALAHHRAAAVADGAPLDAAVDAAIRCARQAVRLLAPERALEVLDRAAALVDASPRPDRALRCDLLLARAEILGFVGERAVLRDLALEAAEDARALRSGVRLAMCARHHFGWGEIGQHDPATVALCEEALELLGDDELRWRAEILAVQSQVLGNNLGDGPRAAAVAEQAVDLARRSGDLDALAATLVALDRGCQGQPGGANRRLAVNDELVRVAASAGDEVMRFAGIRQQAATRLELGDIAGFDAERRAMERVHQRLGSWFSTFWVRCYDATAAILAGRFEPAQHVLDELTTLLAEETNAVNMWAGMQAMLSRERGEAAGLVSTMDAAAARPGGLVIFRVGAASFVAEAGKLDDARSRYEPLVKDGLAVIPRDSTYVACVAGLTETAVRLGDVARAPMLRATLEPFAGQLVVTGAGSFCYGTVDRMIGMLLALEGRHDEAIEAYSRALRTEASAGAEPFRVRTARWLGESLLARRAADDVERALLVLAAALADAIRLGMPLLAGEIESLLERAPALQRPRDVAATSAAHADEHAPH